MAWSGGTTLVILVVLGIAIYAAAASSLAVAATRQLEERLAQLGSGSAVVANGMGQSGATALAITSDPRQPGVAFGGSTSGTIGMVTTVIGAGQRGGSDRGGQDAIPSR